MKFLANMKISHLIMIVAIAPIVAMMFFSIEVIISEVERSSATGKLGRLTTLAVRMSNLVHEQQKERGATAVFVGSSGTSFAAELTSQRQQTDAKREEFQNYLSDFDPEAYGATFSSEFQALLGTLGEMADIRKRVDALSISGPQAISYYTGLNGQNLKLIEFMGSLSPDPVIVSRFVSFSSFLQSKERAGIERAVGANGFATGRFTARTIDRFNELITVQDIYYQMFLTHATDEQTALFNQVMSSDVAIEVQRLRDLVLTGGLTGNLQNVTGKYWFDTITQKINDLKGIENSMSQNLLDELTKLESSAVLSKWFAIGAALIALIFVGVLSLLIIRIITGSFKTIISAMTALTEGNLDIELPSAKANEIGDMIKCVQVFQDNAIQKKAMDEKMAQEQSQKEEEMKNTANLTTNFATNIGTIVESLSSASSELNGTAESMSSIAEKTSNQATAVAASSEEASVNVQTVAAASEEMSNSILEINGQVTSASKAARSAVEEVEKTSVEMKELASTADKIGEVVAMISEIADQTNLLALNATIESARAGEAGKGFAVVASEVKGLAGQTAKATEEITLHIEAVQGATQQAVISMGSIGKVIAKVDEISTSIAAAMEEQGAATQEIARNVQEAAAGTQDVSANISGVTQASQEAGSASSQVLTSASGLSEQAENLKIEVDKYITDMQAA